MPSGSPNPRPAASGAGDVGGRAHPGAAGSENLEPGPTSSASATRHAPSSANPPLFSPTPRPSHPSTRSHIQGPSQERHDDRRSRPGNNQDMPAPTPTPETRDFQEAFLALLSLLPAQKYSDNTPSPPVPSAAGESSGANQGGSKGEGDNRDSTKDG